MALSRENGHGRSEATLLIKEIDSRLNKETVLSVGGKEMPYCWAEIAGFLEEDKIRI